MSLELGRIEYRGKGGGFAPPLCDVGLVVWDIPSIVVEGDGGAGDVGLGVLDFELAGLGVHVGDGALPPLRGVFGPERHGLV